MPIVLLQGKYVRSLSVERAFEAQLRSSAGRRVRPAVVIRCGVDPFAAAELAIAGLVGSR